MTEAVSGCVAFFREHPGFQRPLEEILKKYQSFGKAAGKVDLPNATREERDALRSLFGKTFRDKVSFKTTEFEDALRKTPYAEADLRDVLEAYFGITIRTNRQKRAEKDSRLQRVLETAAAGVSTEEGERWLQSLRDPARSGHLMLQNALKADEKGAQEALLQTVKALGWLKEHPEKRVRLAILAANVTTDPHAFDEDRTAGKFLIQALAAEAGAEPPKGAGEREDLLLQHGILCDSISSVVAQTGLILEQDGEEHPGYRVFRERGEICMLTLGNLLLLQGGRSPSGRAYIVENEMVFSQLCDHSGQFHSPLICTSGQPSIAALRLLDLLAQSGTRMYYSGDFDGKGLSIAAQLMERYPELLEPWHLTEEDYRKCCSGVELSAQSSVLLQNEKRSDLLPVMDAVRKTGRAGYQELVLTELLSDLTAV